MLRTLSRDNDLTWCIVGDFNDILSNDDKRGRAEHPPWLIRGFQEAVQDSQVHDIPMEGYHLHGQKVSGCRTVKKRGLVEL